CWCPTPRPSGWPPGSSARSTTPRAAARFGCRANARAGRPASRGLECRLDAAVPRLDHVDRHSADEGVEGPVADRIDHPLADQLRADAGPRQTLRQDPLVGRMQLRAAEVIGAVASAARNVGGDRTADGPP